MAFRCPECGSKLRVRFTKNLTGFVIRRYLRCPSCKTTRRSKDQLEMKRRPEKGTKVHA